MREEGQTIGTSIIMKFIERFGTQIVNIVLNIIMARLLAPSDYGVQGIITVFVILAQVISQNGISNALIQRNKPDELDYSTALDISLVIAFVLYAVLFFLAEPIASFYDVPEVAVYLRVLALILFPGAFNAVYNARVMKNMQFRIVMITGMVVNLSSCLIGVIAAYFGLGVWALIISQMANVCLLFLMMTLMVKAKISFKFSAARAKILMGYGNKIIVASIIDNLYYDFEGLVIGKLYATDALGYFSNARNYPLRVVSSVKDTLAGVIFPALSNEQTNTSRMKEIVRKSIQVFTFILFPMLMGFAAVSEEFICVLLTDKWLPCLVPMRAFCVGFSFLALSSTNIQVIKALGKSDLNLKIELVRKALLLITLLVSLFIWGTIDAIAIASVVAISLTAIMVAYIGGRLIGFPLFDQLLSIMNNVLITIAMLFVLWLVSLVLPSSWFGYLSLFIKIIVGMVSYFGFAWITKNPTFYLLISKCKPFLYSIKRNRE